MRKIVCIVHPFLLDQTLFVYDELNEIDKVKCKLDDLSKEVLKLSEQYDISNVSLTGAKKFTENLGRKIQEAELKKYLKHKLNISYF